MIPAGSATLMTSLRFIALVLLVPLIAVGCDSGGVTSPPPPDSTPNAGTQVAEPEVASDGALFDYVTERARRLARSSYVPGGVTMPSSLTNLDYDQYRAIRFRPEAALWRDESDFEVQLFHPGYLYDEPVRIHLVRNEKIAELGFDPSLFRYDGPAAPVAALVSPGLGYAGFRVHYPLNDATIKDEVIVFLGASYFRLVGRGQVYGLSSRGLAVDAGLEKPEEFPDFREFWLVQPEPEATSLTMYALLDSPSVAGAYRFELQPDTDTTLMVDARILARRDIAKLGIAPMSSMFLFDQNRQPYFDDFRAQVHDSDGASVHSAEGEWVWRPLNNGPGTHVTSLSRGPLRGFGLFQRDRTFESYLDLEAAYERRPSEWVEVEDPDWGDGWVELLTFETRNEFADNVALYWVPAHRLEAGDERSFRYRLTTLDGHQPEQTLGYVARTRIGLDDLTRATTGDEASPRRIVIDFIGGSLSRLGDVEPVAVVDAAAGLTSDLNTQALPNQEGWRASFQLAPRRDEPSDLRLHLEADGVPVTETWSYTWHPR